MNRIKSFASVAIIALVTTVLTVFNSGCSKDEGLIPDAQMAEKEMLVLRIMRSLGLPLIRQFHLTQMN